MHKLLSIWILLLLTLGIQAQSTHGDDFKMDCAACHSPDSWEIPMDFWHFEKPVEKRSEMTGWLLPMDSSGFNHYLTAFELEGGHIGVDCRMCHPTLIFNEADTDCISCHTDMHAQTAGNDCARCHTVDTWLVDHIPELHEENGFPLVGAHENISCNQCHVSETDLRFDRIGNDCINCHLDDFNKTQSPDHEELGFSKNCIECHDPLVQDWNTEIIDHSFFPLTLGHDIQDCAQCHLTGNFSDTSPECISCHQDDFNETSTPDHETADFTTVCTACHTTDPGWQPAIFSDHDTEHFPIYSGAHENHWNDCAECHTNSENYAEFTCIACHINPETDDAHTDVGGYVYDDNACLACHPTGDTDMVFDHNATNFPLTGAHLDTDCLQCHEDGYEGTSTNCVDCHTQDYDNSVNPNHNELNLPTDCASCHTTDPDWMPASFDIHDDFYPLNGAHAAISNDCATCHNGDYVNTPNTCIGCHLDDFENTTDPDHAAAQFSTDCTSCHTEDAWTPATFDHDGQYFPIYSGAHDGQWSECAECHNNPDNYADFTCIACHINPETDDAHTDVGGYVYDDNACLACHPTGDTDMVFDHNATNFPLTGAHLDADCLQCHEDGYEGTSTNCVDCHTQDYDNSVNPNHNELNLPTDCASCHTTDPDWMPASFDIHDDFYPLNGAHAANSNDCATCHNGDYVNTPNTCIGCHLDDFENTTDPDHSAAQFSTDCTSCHTEDAWTPATFDHDGEYFPIYSGAHDGHWSECAECHNNPDNYAEFTCIACHINPETDDAHTDVGGYVYEDNACLACHPTGDTDMVFDHNATNFPLTGAHLDADCLQCHEDGYEGTSTNCVDCHTQDYNNSVNPNHNELNLPTDCASCHTTDPDWMPASFDIHDDFYPLNGAHAAISNDCATCHNGDYVNTPNTCVGCHLDDFENTTDPDHAAAQFSTDCTSCHTEDAWTPATFDHDGQYFPIYSGAHDGQWSECAECHNNPDNYAEFTCIACHLNPETDDAHTDVGGYIYDDNACLACHPTGDTDMVFDHNATNFPLTGAHLDADCLQCHEDGYEGTSTNCVDCHTQDYDNSVNPNHNELNLPTDCASCHTTDPDWMPASFDIHDDFYPLNGAHAAISNDCATCHNGDYVNTPNTCVGCHLENFNNTSNPNHTEANFSTDCTQCHTEDAWVPTTFDHNSIYPLLGAHAAIANECNACHEGDYNNTPNTCVGCHQDNYNNTTNPNHSAAQFSTDCASCHSEDAWMPANFGHDGQYFPIYSGAHDGQWSECAECHINPDNYAEFTCIACHINPETDDAHTDVGGYVYDDNACLACHPTGDTDMVFDHNATNFPLTGAHLDADCLQCHEDGYEGTSTNCVDCHTQDYDNSVNPNHNELNLPTDCASCHTTDPDWIPASFEIHDDFYPLNGAHAVIANDCATCHNGDYVNTPNTCVGCHLEDFNNTSNPNHTEANFSTDCTQCHTEDAWVPTTFDHNNIYPLLGAHAAIANECNTCHEGDYNNTPNTCVGCHQDNYNNTTNPNHIAAQFSTDCASCHSEDAWMPANFDHDGQYFPINSGAHDGHWSECAECHNNPDNYAEFTCIACHINPETDDAHTDVGGYIYDDNACLACHPTGDTDMVFDHNATNFPLTGAHLDADCLQCHENGYEGTSTNCVDCHTQDYDNSINPNHNELNLPTDCASCHTTDPDWMPASFDIHDDFYPLNGAHAAISNDCATCHNGDYVNTPNTCVGCHLENFNNTTNPNHTEANFSTDCTQCHTEDAWVPTTFDHNSIYPLLGAHAAIANECNACHEGDYNNTPNTCVGCHQDNYNNTTNPNHIAAQFSTDCASCHSEDAWMPANFDHDGQYFPIYSGAHDGQWSECAECHNNPDNYAEFTCIACHINPETDDAHTDVGGYVYDDNACLACHPTGDTDMVFDHNATNFPLTGAHLDTDCLQCHEDGYEGTSTNCVDCHTQDYDNSVNPNHNELNLPTDCASCHTTDPDWMPASFDIHDDFYPLNGAHAVIANDCATCHNGDYVNTPNTCVGCHLENFNNTSNPNHTEANFSTDCTQCHTEDAWVPTSFDHNTIYPLLGAHAAIANECNACHEGDYNNTPNTCVGCHQDNYNNTTNPNHIAAQFSTDCASCHSEDAWTPANFDHDGQYFPIYSGAHVGTWSECQECHTNPNNYAEFTCITCHVNPETNNVHNTVGGYIYEDNACLACHPTGQADEGIDHNATNFPLTGAHVFVDCIDCHGEGYQGTPTDCNSCHNEDFNTTANPNHNALGLSTDCASCHTTEPGWTPATFDNHDDYYELTGAHIPIANECAQCHNGDYNNTPNTCAGCHIEDYNQSLNPNHNNLGIPTDCETCHTTDPGWIPASFDIHDNYYPLTGEHMTIANDCVLCHNGDYNNTPNTCAGCHLEDYNQSTNPDHQALNIPTDCVDCHTTDADWMPAAFAIHDDYYQLNGAHALIANDCASCHNGDYNNTPNTCVGCHLDNYNSTIAPNHTDANFSTDCTQCHTEDAWIPSTFEHDAFYPLVGAHALIANDCNTCHNGDYTNTPNTCVGCHQEDYNNTTNPNHIAAQFSTDCASCHSEDAWMPATFDHDGQFFPIYSGAHNGQWSDCIDCHTNPDNYAEFTCIACHINPETDNSHSAVGGYAYQDNACLACHPTGQADDGIDHNATNFPLTGAHVFVDCMECHAEGYQGTPTGCNSCHNNDFNATTNPNHNTLGISTDCAACHTTDPGWMPASFNIHDNYYPLTGEHLPIANDCVLCHNGDYNNTPNTCAGCHLDDYNQSTNPDHQALNIPTDCVDCHTTDPDWMPASFDIHDNYYALNGAHALIANDCAGCHNGDYNNTPNTCVGCHLDDYNATTSPNHLTANFSTDCAACHLEDAWVPSTFDHDAIYPLTGAHALIANDCILCHADGYDNTPNTCIGCHLDDFNNTNDPDHQSAQFPTDCTECHNDNAWIPSSFDHDGMYFPIYSGKHKDEWVLCMDCHFNTNGYSQFNCLDCHEHNNPTQVANLHEDVPEYIYESNACFACHPDGTD